MKNNPWYDLYENQPAIDKDKKFLRNKTSRKDYLCLPESYIQNKANGIKNGHWSIDEHVKFIDAAFKFGNKWKEIVNVIKTRSCHQARSHSQKLFSKLKKINLDGLDVEILNLKDLKHLVTIMSIEEKAKLKDLLIQAHINMEKMGSSDSLDFVKESEYNNFKLKEDNLEQVNSIKKLNENTIIMTTNSRNTEKIIKNKSSAFSVCLQKSEVGLLSPLSLHSSEVSPNKWIECKGLKKKKQNENKIIYPKYLKNVIHSINMNSPPSCNIPNNNFTYNNCKKFNNCNYVNDFGILSVEEDQNVKLKKTQFMNDNGDIRGPNQNMQLIHDIINNIKRENPAEILYRMLNDYQDEVCMKNFCEKD